MKIKLIGSGNNFMTWKLIDQETGKSIPIRSLKFDADINVVNGIPFVQCEILLSEIELDNVEVKVSA